MKHVGQCPAIIQPQQIWQYVFARLLTNCRSIPCADPPVEKQVFALSWAYIVRGVFVITTSQQK